MLGASARTIPTGALRGVIGLIAAVAAYYVLIAIFGQGFRAIGASHAATIWGAVALVAGPVMGGAGAVWRHGDGWPRAIGVALLAAALFAEGVRRSGRRGWSTSTSSATDPGALLFARRDRCSASPCRAMLLRRGERLRGYVAMGALAVVAGAGDRSRHGARPRAGGSFLSGRRSRSTGVESAGHDDDRLEPAP